LSSQFVIETCWAVLLVRGRGDKGTPLTVADGYHRICASHHIDEDADVPCRLVALPSIRAVGSGHG
jgi:hypothetical protein